MSAVQRQSEQLHHRVRAMVTAFELGEPMPETFDSLAVDITRYQARHVPGYARLCASRGIDPSLIQSPSEAPAVPTDAFKLTHVFAFDPHEARFVFRTSGTSSGERGEHFLRDGSTYDAAAFAFGRAALELRPTQPVAVLVLGPPASEAADSSLAHMYSTFVEKLGGKDAVGGSPYFVRNGELDVDALRARAASLPSNMPALILSTSLALVHLLAQLEKRIEGRRLPLPTGSRIVHTGGFKGRWREKAAPELRSEVARLFAVPERAVVCEYGMTELSSQFWEAPLYDTPSDGRAIEERTTRPVYVEPPWARVIPVDPETLRPLRDGEVGIARIEDLANVDSAFAILAEDLVRRTANGFELLGRQLGAPARGCSIAIDEILSLREAASPTDVGAA